jgi:hypothetical protein
MAQNRHSPAEPALMNPAKLPVVDRLLTVILPTNRGLGLPRVAQINRKQMKRVMLDQGRTLEIPRRANRRSNQSLRVRPQPPGPALRVISKPINRSA